MTVEQVTDERDSRLFRGVQDNDDYSTTDTEVLAKVWQRILNSLPVDDTVTEELKAHGDLHSFQEIHSSHGTRAQMSLAIVGISDVDHFAYLADYAPWIEWIANNKHSTPVELKIEDRPNQ